MGRSEPPEKYQADRILDSGQGGAAVVPLEYRRLTWDNMFFEMFLKLSALIFIRAFLHADPGAEARRVPLFLTNDVL